jgi:uncharacterized protein
LLRLSAVAGALIDTAIWPLRFTTTDDDLTNALRRIAADEQTVRRFLADGGIQANAVSVQQFAVIDQLAQQYRSGPIASRYIVSQTLLVRSNLVEKIETLAQQVGVLVSAGVILSNEGGFQSGPNYLYTQLNTIKPAMLAEALANAREGAAEFARDAGASTIGNAGIPFREGNLKLSERERANRNPMLRSLIVVATWLCFR